MTGQNSLFHRPRSFRIILQLAFVVISLDHQGMHLSDSFLNQLRGEPEIREESDRAVTAGSDETDRIDSIVRHIKGLNIQISNRKGAPGAKYRPRSICSDAFTSECFSSQPVTINRDLEFAAKHIQAGGVISVLMREQNGVQAIRGDAKRS